MHAIFLREIVTIFTCIGFFTLGCILPDIDHPAVQKKFHFKWLGKITRHRGHVHSIITAITYALGILGIVMLFRFYYWQYPVLFGFLGFISHLIEDDLNRYKLNSKPTRGFKLW